MEQQKKKSLERMVSWLKKKPRGDVAENCDSQEIVQKVNDDNERARKAREAKNSSNYRQRKREELSIINERIKILEEENKNLKKKMELLLHIINFLNLQLIVLISDDQKKLDDARNALNYLYNSTQDDQVKSITRKYIDNIEVVKNSNYSSREKLEMRGESNDNQIEGASVISEEPLDLSSKKRKVDLQNVDELHQPNSKKTRF